MSVPEATRIALALLRRDGGTQIRAQISMDVAKEYAEAMGRGDRFPPLEARYDGTHHWLTDGFHRALGAELNGEVAVEVLVRPGTRRDAILDAVGANAAHGFRRSNSDKRQAVLTLLEDAEWAQKSDRQIAKLAHVDPGMVGRLRPPPSAAEPQTRTVTRGGTTFEMNVTPINRDRRNEPSPAPTATPRGSRQLRVFLGEFRQGADLESAAVVAELSLGEAQLHLEAEEAGEYADIIAIDPNWKIMADQLTIRPDRDSDVESDLPSLIPANDAQRTDQAEGEPEAEAFGFDDAQRYAAVMGAIGVLATAPPIPELASMWARPGVPGVPVETVERAAAWMAGFAEQVPAADARRQQSINITMEKL